MNDAEIIRDRAGDGIVSWDADDGCDVAIGSATRRCNAVLLGNRKTLFGRTERRSVEIAIGRLNAEHIAVVA
jgi:hypothetical protein